MDANPASIDPAAPDVDVDDLHDFGDVDLVALRRLTRVFPEEASSVTQHSPVREARDLVLFPADARRPPE
jgi:hypothetical protein